MSKEHQKLDGLRANATLIASVKAISTQQAAEQFDQYSELANQGEKILVTRDGKPWVLLPPRCIT